jgi:hypothetical protein
MFGDEVIALMERKGKLNCILAKGVKSKLVRCLKVKPEGYITHAIQAALFNEAGINEIMYNFQFNYVKFIERSLAVYELGYFRIFVYCVVCTGALVVEGSVGHASVQDNHA